MKIKGILAVAGFAVVLSAPAQAEVIDFLTMANGNEYGTSTLTVGTNGILDITATKGEGDGFAYLDNGDAGLGVCGAINSSNQCIDASDDNVTSNEELTFSFKQLVRIDGIWINNNHDNPYYFSAGDTVMLNGQESAPEIYDAKTSYNALDIEGFFFGEVSQFTLGYNNDANSPQFYVSKIAYTIISVPEPATLGLLALGLFGLGAARKKRA